MATGFDLEGILTNLTELNKLRDDIAYANSKGDVFVHSNCILPSNSAMVST